MVKKSRCKHVRWQDLQKEDVIKVSAGPIYLNNNGICNHVGYRGKYIVSSIEPDGIRAHLPKSKFSVFIYMGEEKSLDSGTLLKQHKIQLIKSGKII